MTPILSPALRQDVAARFRALGDETRLAMLDTLLRCGPQSVGELAAAVGSSHANVSKHLRVLLECDLVAREKRGNSVIYAIDDPHLAQICELACSRLVELANVRVNGYASPVLQ